MTQAKLQTARELIQEHHYDAARAVLKTISDDPTAQRWLKQLNARYPSPAQRNQNQIRSYLISALVIGIVVLAIVLFAKQQSDQSFEVSTRVSFLMDCNVEIQVEYGVTMQQAGTICTNSFWETWKDDVLACYRQYDNYSRRVRCLEENNVPKTPL